MKKQMDDLKALSEIDFSKVRIEKLRVADIELWGEVLLSIRYPQKGSPVWEVRYQQNENEVRVIYAASTPIVIEAVEIKQEHEEEASDDDE